MCDIMDCKVVVFLGFFIALTQATKVNLTSVWKPDLGWEITCSWTLFSNDSLQSVRLCDNDHQFMIYRPQDDGPSRTEVFRRPEHMVVECAETMPRGIVGSCLLTIELYQPQTQDFAYSCEVSGERPKFRMAKKNIVIDAFVPPTDAVIELQSTHVDSGRVMVNCTSNGMPAPHLVWTIGDQKVPPDFTGSFWNMTSKLWHVWSVLSYTHSYEHKAVCTPEITKGGETTKGVSAMYNSADIVTALTQATKVNLTSVWKPDLGWEITCSWTLFSNDSLQSVRLCDNDHQFMIYRPQDDGPSRTEVFRRPEHMVVECAETMPRGIVGSCLLTIELYQPQTQDFAYSCEVSGERPKFRMAKKNIVIDAFVPPTDAVIELQSTHVDSGRVMVNCTSNGMPAPHLVWTIGDQKVPPDFTGSFWNMTSKLWHVWSVLSYTHSYEHKAVCTPEITKGGETTKGVSAMYNSADIVTRTGTFIAVIWMPLLLLG